VIIPARNTKHLALRRDIVEAVESGHFSVYAVNIIEEALELLTGIPVGERGLYDSYQPDTVFGRAALRLEEMAHAVAQWSEEEKKPIRHIITES
jgi:predicted ATP-dependent protease